MLIIDENINEVIYILRKNILLLINNEAIKMKTIRNIKLNGGNIIENFEEEKVDLIVYQPSSKITNILDKAKKDNLRAIDCVIFNYGTSAIINMNWMIKGFTFALTGVCDSVIN